MPEVAPITPPVDLAAAAPVVAPPAVVPPSVVPPAAAAPAAVVPPAVVAAPAAAAPAAPAAVVPPAATPAAPVAPAAIDAPSRGADTIEQRLAQMEAKLTDQTRARIIAENGIKPEAASLITAGDEAGMIAQAANLKALGLTVQPPIVGAVGTVTNPGAAAPAETLDQKIAAADKGTSRVSAMALKLQAIGR